MRVPALLAAALTVLSLVACQTSEGGPSGITGPLTAPAAEPAHDTLSGAFLGSGQEGVDLLPYFDTWRGGRESLVGHTYLPGNSWADIEGAAFALDPWTAWRAADPDRMLVLNVPMSDRNEAGLSDDEVADTLRRGADGEFDPHYRVLAERLVARSAADTVIVLGWEMNGQTYSGRCGPDPEAWKTYWRSVVETMRAVDGARFRFDFTPSRGTDDVPWDHCYPGDDVVDVIGTDTYDQPPGASFADYVEQPYGLRFQAEFAAARGKPLSFAEWGLFRRGDNPDFVRGMHEWIATHDVVYETVTDYCPHGVWQCEDAHPESAAVYRELFGRPNR